MGEPAETPGERTPDGRWAPGTLVRTPDGVRARVLPCFSGVSDPGGDSVFIQPIGRPERPWQLVSSSELDVLPDENL